MARYKIDVLGSPSPIHGAQGIALGPDGALYAASVYGHSVYRIDIATGAITTFVGPVQGAADDVAFAPDGTVVWTNISEGVVYARGADGEIRALARNMPGVNGIAFSPAGKLFVTCVIARDGLYEVDLSGSRSPRTVIENLGNLNAFQFADEKTIYGPLMVPGKVARIDVETGAIAEVAAGFVLPTSVRIERDGQLIAIDYRKGEVVRVNPRTGGKAVVASLPCHLDNCAIGKDGTIYVSSPDYNGVTAIDAKTSAQRRVVWSDLSGPEMLNMANVDGKEQIVLADIMVPRLVDPDTGKAQPINSEVHLSGSLAIAMNRDTYAVTVRGNVIHSSSIQVIERATGKLRATLSNLGAPYDVKILADGFVVADFAAGEVVKIASDDSHTRTILAAGLDGPLGLADAGGGVFYVSERKSGRITRIDAMSSTRKVVVEGLESPEGIALMPDGRVAVAEVGGKRVLALDIGSGRSTVLADRLAIGLTVNPNTTAPFFPTGVAVGKDGRVYVSGTIDNVLYCLIPVSA